MNEKIYADNDTIHVGLWKQLIYWGCCDQAAVGLLCDVFHMLETCERAAAEGKEMLPFHKDGLTGRAALREDLMVMLDDSNGQKLKMWQTCYRDDRDAFLEFASDWVEEAQLLAHK